MVCHLVCGEPGHTVREINPTIIDQFVEPLHGASDLGIEFRRGLRLDQIGIPSFTRDLGDDIITVFQTKNLHDLGQELARTLLGWNSKQPHLALDTIHHRKQQEPVPVDACRTGRAIIAGALDIAWGPVFGLFQVVRIFDKLRANDVLVVRWVDRLGRNYSDVTDSIREFMRTGVVVKTVINSMTFDGSTTDPIQQAVRDALIAFMAATAQAQAEVTKEAQKAGIARAKTDDRKYPGRKPSYNRDTFDVVRDLLTKCTGASEIARTTGLSRQAILRIREDPASAETALARWGM